MAKPMDEPHDRPARARLQTIRFRLRTFGERLRTPAARRRTRVAALFALGVLAAFLAVALAGALFPGPKPLTSADVDRSIASALASVTPGPALSEQAYAAVRPAVVQVETRDGGAGSPSPDDSPGPSGNATGSLGSGVLVDAAGDILTSLHVVADATSIEVTFADGSQVPATVASREPDQDIAVLRVGALPSAAAPAVLGNPGAVRVGSEAYVVGNPFGLTGSMSAGVVSGLDRSFKLPAGGAVLHGLIQVDAAVNPGNSGGPLVDRYGRVLGIVTGLVNPSGQDFFVGIGFAVPIDVAGGAAGLPQY